MFIAFYTVGCIEEEKYLYTVISAIKTLEFRFLSQFNCIVFLPFGLHLKIMLTVGIDNNIRPLYGDAL